MRKANAASSVPCATPDTKSLIENYINLLDVVRVQEEALKKQCDEIPQILDQWQGCARRLNAEIAEHRNLKQDVKALEAEISSQRADIANLQSALRNAKAETTSKQHEINTLRNELQQNQSRLQLIRDIMQTHLPGFSDEVKEKLHFLKDSQPVRTAAGLSLPSNGSRDTADDTVDELYYDESMDSQDILGHQPRTNRSSRMSAHINRRRSTSVQPQPTKRERSLFMADVVEDDQQDLPHKRSRDGYAKNLVEDFNSNKKTPRAPVNRSLNRSMSANDIIGEKVAFGIQDMVVQNHLRGTSTADLRTPLRPVTTSTWIKNGNIETRKHTFVKLSTTFKMTSCAVCYGGINIVGRPAQKCKDCHQHVHTQCRTRLGVPCVPRLETSLKTPSKAKNGIVLFKLQDYCPASSPMIAWPIVHCITELEKRGLAQEGLYRVPGKKNTVTNVLNEFRTSRAIPKLDIVDSEVVADVVKQFLRELRDPLIPKTSRDEFIKAAMTDQMQALNMSIFDLPQANRDTLAYLILHWQRVAAECQMNKMPLENIARCVAIAVMGQSTYNAGDMGTAARETGDRERVLFQLLSIDAEYWQRYLFANPKLALTPVTIPTSSRSVRPISDAATSRRHLDNSTKFHSSADYSLLGPITPAKVQSLIRQPEKPDRYFPDPY